MMLSELFRSRIEVARNPSCEELDLSNDWYVSASDKLTDIPSEVFQLTHLKKLNLSGNRLTYLSKQLFQLVNLTHLDLRDNLLEELPTEISFLANLLELKLSGNKLINLPNTIGELTNLKLLLLDHNDDLLSLPETIINLSENLCLDVSRNRKLGKPPLEVAQGGIVKIREYFQQIQKEGEESIYEAKLIIVGEPRVGKTSLANKIYNSKYKLRNDEPMTRGINIIHWLFSQDGHNYVVNIWDFGGQDIQKATHKFFLTKRSLYILMTNTRLNTDNSKFYDWLSLIKTFSNNSPVIIVKNEEENSSQDIGEYNFKRDFENIEYVLCTNLKINKGFDNVIDEVKHSLKRLLDEGYTLPSNWYKVRQSLMELRKHGRDYIEWSEYEKICEQYQIKNPKELMSYFHDFGVCLHYDTLFLNKIIILNPSWATDAVYQLLFNQEVINNSGAFTVEELTRIWPEQKYKNRRDEILQLMQDFQFCYEIRDKRHHYIVPELLSPDKPDYAWDTLDNLTVFCKYDDKLMPKEIITRLIVVLHRYIEDQEYVWKNGVFLEYRGKTSEAVTKCRIS